MGNLSVDQRVAALIRDWILEQQKKGVTQDAMRKQLGGVSRTTIINVRDSAKGAGPKLEKAFANLMFGGSIDALRRVACGEEPEGSSPAVFAGVPLGEDDKTRRTYEFAVLVLGISEEAAQRVHERLANSDQKLESHELLDCLRVEEMLVRRGVAALSSQKQGGSPWDDDSPPDEEDDPYPSRREVLRRIAGILDERVLKHVADEKAPTGVDPGPRWWLRHAVELDIAFGVLPESHKDRATS